LSVLSVLSVLAVLAVLVELILDKFELVGCWLLIAW